MLNNRYKNKALALVVGSITAGFAMNASAFEFDVDKTKVKIYGYAKLDIIYDVNEDLGAYYIPVRNKLDGVEVPEGHTRMQAYESRIGVSTETQTEKGPLKTVIEGDFFADSGESGNFRMRHAYGSWNGWLAGKTYTNFTAGVHYYPTIDFMSAVAFDTQRRAQLRYTTGKYSVALEEPGDPGLPSATIATGIVPAFVGVGAPTDSTGVEKNSMPDLTLRYTSRGKTSYAAAVVLRNLAYDTVTREESALGWGIHLAASHQLNERVKIRGSLTHGDGVGNYLNHNPGASAYVDPVTGDLNTVTATGGNASISIKAGPGDINLGVGMATANWDNAVRDGLPNISAANKMFRSTHLNYIWSPYSNISVGAEVAYHEREIQNGEEGDAVRLQGMVKYTF